MRNVVAISVLGVVLATLGCGGGGGGSGADDGTNREGSVESVTNCDGSCPNQRLLASDVDRILRQGVATAQSLGVAATFSVVDRVGNVLAVYVMPGANPSTTINGQIGAQGGLEGASVPSVLAAISKAGTGAYLSSQGNAFTSRTASQIVQENFNPGERFQAGGPLFGVQFSQFICSDTNMLNPDLLGGAATGSKPLGRGLTGPRPLPLGLSADPGGLPIYKNGDMVGGIGVELDGLYTLDRDLSDFDDDPEERIALSATLGGFETPSDRSANAIFVLGKSFRFADLEYSQLAPLPEPLPPLDAGGLTPVGGFFAGSIIDGSVFGEPGSGVAKTVRAGVPAAVLVDDAGNVRFPSRAGAGQGGLELQANEVEAILDSALTTASRARAAIRRPLDTAVRVSIWVVDINGAPLGFVRSEDAPIFGIDVALQKGRTAVFFSRSDAADALRASGLGSYVDASQALLGAQVFTGAHAFADRSIGNLARPFFLDGINGNPPGPLSLPFPGTEFAVGASATWSPFNTGLQLDVILPQVVAPLSGVFPDDCAPQFGGRLNNGTQIFAGAVPLYRNGVLIGGIGISGDGIDQDDMVAFYGSSRRGLDFVGHTAVGDPVLGFNAPSEIRADKIDLNFPNGRLRYVNCPEGPFSGSNDQKVCDGL